MNENTVQASKISGRCRRKVVADVFAGQPYLTLTYMVDKSVNYQYTTEVKQILPLSIAPRLLKKKEKSVIISNRCV